MNSIAVPNWVFGWLPKKRENPSIHTLASYLVIEQTAEQKRYQVQVEKALADTADALRTIERAATFLTMDVDTSLRDIMGKAYAARRKAAKRIFVDTQLED